MDILAALRQAYGRANSVTRTAANRARNLTLDCVGSGDCSITPGQNMSA